MKKIYLFYDTYILIYLYKFIYIFIYLWVLDRRLGAASDVIYLHGSMTKPQPVLSSILKHSRFPWYKRKHIRSLSPYATAGFLVQRTYYHHRHRGSAAYDVTPQIQAPRDFAPLSAPGLRRWTCAAHTLLQKVWDEWTRRKTGRQSRPHTWRGDLQCRSTSKGASGMKKEKAFKNVWFTDGMRESGKARG